uniref:G2/mitotic-specific cyclin-B3 n=1 Tax=Steinernema glaseri TaxID=37863 RepID=A0A1I7YG73_9BILA
MKFQVIEYCHQTAALEKRAITVDHLVETARVLDLSQEALFLAVRLLDLFLSKTKEIVKLEDLRVLASSSLLMAAKYIQAPPVHPPTFAMIARNVFTMQDIRETETKILNVMEFELGITNAYSFHREYTWVLKMNKETRDLSRYVLETSQLSMEFTTKRGSLVAAASILLALRMNENTEDWPPVLETYTGYKLEDVEPVARSLKEFMERAPELHPNQRAIFRKYTHGKRSAVAETFFSKP